MTKDDIIRMAREAGGHPSHNPDLWDIWNMSEKDLERFAALVIANHPPQSFMTWQEGYEAGKLGERAKLQAFMRQMIDAYTLPSNSVGVRKDSAM